MASIPINALYAYCDNQVLLQVDPDGLQPQPGGITPLDPPPGPFQSNPGRIDKAKNVKACNCLARARGISERCIHPAMNQDPTMEQLKEDMGKIYDKDCRSVPCTGAEAKLPHKEGGRSVRKTNAVFNKTACAPCQREIIVFATATQRPEAAKGSTYMPSAEPSRALETMRRHSKRNWAIIRFPQETTSATSMIPAGI